jgi:DNA adenine methylase
MHAAHQKCFWDGTDASLLHSFEIVSQATSHLFTHPASLFCGFCIRLLASFLCLYEIPTPANLMKRFDQVDIEALASSSLSEEILTTSLYMKGPLPYIGGKNRIAAKIIEFFPQHKTYVETFAGGAQVFFHKEPSTVEILNDLDGEVVSFFRVCQSHYEELLRYLKFTVASRAWFDLLQALEPKTLTDVQRAARFLYLQKNAYAGLVKNRRFAYAVEGPSRLNPERLPELIENTHKRLARVQIECSPYQDVLRRYDRPTTLFYLDPPYFDRKLYRFNFSENDFKELAQRLGRLEGKFILSLNDVPDVRRIFAGFKLREINLPYTAQREAGKRFRELLISNFPLRPRGER